jgi:hypothetical protein
MGRDSLSRIDVDKSSSHQLSQNGIGDDLSDGHPVIAIASRGDALSESNVPASGYVARAVVLL